MEGPQYRRIFRDIVRGYSSSRIDSQTIYIKHLCPHDQVEIEEIEEEYHSDALNRGVPTEAEMMAFLKKEGDWTDEEDAQIKRNEIFLDSLLRAKSKIVLQSQVEQQDGLIKETREKLQKKKAELVALLGNTCEKYARERVNDFYVIKSFFKDSCCEAPLYSEESFDELPSLQIFKLVKTFNESFANIDEKRIQHLILQDFYSPYMPFAENSVEFFGKAFCELTYSQIKLMVFSKMFRNIFESDADIPDKIRRDPVALIDYASTAREEKDKLREKVYESDGSTIVGASKEDYNQLGLGDGPTVDLHEEAKKKGGTLSMQDLMKLSGVD